MFDIIGYAAAAFAFICVPVAAGMWITFALWSNVYASYMKEHLPHYRLPEWITNISYKLKKDVVSVPIGVLVLIQIVMWFVAMLDTLTDVGQYRYDTATFHENLYRIYGNVCEIASYPLGWVATILVIALIVNQGLKFVAKVNAAMIKMK